jgi:hypothetical protein
MSGGDFVGIFHGAEQLKADCPPALPAKGKPVAGQQRGFMHQTMRVMSDAVDTAFWNQLSGPMLPFQNQLPLVRPKSEHAILKDFQLSWQARRGFYSQVAKPYPMARSQFQKLRLETECSCQSERLRYNRATFFNIHDQNSLGGVE